MQLADKPGETQALFYFWEQIDPKIIIFLLLDVDTVCTYII